MGRGVALAAAWPDGVRALLIGLIALLVAGAPPARAQEVNRFNEAQLIDGFVRTVFGGEDEAPADARERVKRFTRPVRVFVDPIRSAVVTEALGQQRKREAEAIVRAVAERVPAARITVVQTFAEANVLIALTDRANYVAVGTRLWGGRTDFLRTTICAGLPGWREDYSLERAVVVVPIDEGTRLFAACIAEEFLQALGPVNDDDRLPFSTFNDKNELDGFPLFDQWILNMLYHPRVRPGMREAEVRAVLPSVIRELRERVEGAARQRAQPGQRVGFATAGLVWD